MKKDIIKIFSMLIILIGLIIVFVKSSWAESLPSSWDKNGDGVVSDYDLALCTKDSGWFDWDMTQVVGKTVELHVGSSKETSTIRQTGAYCVHNEYNSNIGGSDPVKYQIVNVVDIDTAAVASKCNSSGRSDLAGYPGGVISYGQKNNDIIWSRQNNGAAHAVRLAYLTAKSIEKGETKVASGASTTGMYKRAIHDAVLVGAPDMNSGIGLNSSMNTGTNSVNKDDPYSWTQAQGEADNYLETVRTYKFD